MRLLTIGLAAALAIGASAALAQMDHGSHGGMDAGAMGAASKAYMDAMTKMNDEMAGMVMSGKAGVDFAVMMIPHHQSAIDMAKAYLASGENDPELTKLSNDIIAAQEAEIAFLKAWIAKQPK
jgi:uncharacterized protein (DUF305 family)